MSVLLLWAVCHRYRLPFPSPYAVTTQKINIDTLSFARSSNPTLVDVFVVVHVDGERLCLCTAATKGLLFIPQIKYEYGEPRWNDIDRRKQELEENLSQCHLNHYKSHMN